MGDDENNATPPSRSRTWIRNLLIAGAVLLVVFALFHGPILRPIVRSVAIHFAAKENLKLDFRIEGSVLGSLVLKNVHGTATGPSAVQSIDADLVRADYSLWGLIFHGMSGFLQNVELRSASIVLDPAKSPPSASPNPNEKISLPGFFPDEMHLENVNLTLRDQPQDMVLQNLNLDLNPHRDGALKIDRLQIPGLHTWTNVTATTSYANKNLFLRDLTFDEQNKFQVVNLDASHIGSKALDFSVDGSLVGGDLKGKVSLKKKKKSFATEVNLSADQISLGKLAEYFGQPAGFIAGDVKDLKIEGTGVLKKPNSWNGSISAHVSNVRQKDLALDSVDLDVAAANGMATIKKAEIVAGNNHVEVSGSATLPDSTSDFGRAPADLKLLIHAPNLKQLTGFLTPPITGNAEGEGSIRIKNETIFLRLSVNGNEIGFDKAVAKQLVATINASKKMPARKSKEPYYTNLVSNIHAEFSDVRYDQYLVDSVRADVSSSGKEVSVRRVAIMRNANEVSVDGKYELPPAGKDPMQQTG